MNNRNYIVEIDLFDLAKYLLSKWKQLLLSMVVGALLLGGYTFYNNHNSSNSSDTVELTTPLFTLTEREKVSAYFEYQNLILSLKEDLDSETDYQTKIEITNSIVDVRSKIFGLGLSDEQLKKVETYDAGKQSIEEFVTSEVVNFEAVTLSNNNSSIAKQGVLGALIGCFVVCMLYSFLYALSGTIKTKREFKVYGIFALGNIDDFEVISSHLKEMTTKEVAFASTLDLSNIPSNISCVGNPLKEVDGLKAINNKDIVLVEELKKSNRQDVIDLKEFLEYSGFKIIGVILL